MQTQYNEAYQYGYNDGFRAGKVEMDVLRQQLAECQQERDEHIRNWNRVVNERMAVEKERDMLVDALKTVCKIECVDDLWKAQAALAKLGKTGEET